jgi:hypothetical protein
MGNLKKLSLKTKLLIYEYKEKYPIITAGDISEMFDLQLEAVLRLFKQGEINIPSKLNKKK